jgi:hypothetical protein
MGPGFSPAMLEQFLAEFGYNNRQIPDIAGKYAGKGKSLAVCGDAACVWDDLERLGCRYNHMRGKVYRDGWDFLTINKLVETFPGNIEHAYSNEPHLLERYVAARRPEYRREFDGPRHSHSCVSGAKWHWPWGGHATSGLGAAIVGACLGYDQVVLCGVPLNDGPHNGEPPWRKCTFTREAADSSDGVNRYWLKARELVFKGKVKSMSGRTRDWLGTPTL